MVESIARVRHIRVTPMKARRVVDLIRGKQDRAWTGGVVRDAHHAPAVVGGLQAQH